MQTIAKNEFYEIHYDDNKNRVYFKIIGLWNSPKDVPNYISDIQKTANTVKSGFTLVSDITQMRTPPQEVGELHEQAQQILVRAGLDKTAEVVTSSILKMTANQYAKKSNMTKQTFTSKEEAENWLES